MADEFEVINNADAGRFEIHLGGDVAFTEYRPFKSGYLFPHTLVPESMEGKGVGGELVKAAMAWVREQGQLVLPTCTFVAGYITRHPEYHDLVHPDYRTALGI